MNRTLQNYLHKTVVKLLRITLLYSMVLSTSGNALRAQNCTLSTGWQTYPYTPKVGIVINFGVSIDVSAGIFGEDASIGSKFRECSRVDMTQIYYEGKLYTNITHPQLFEEYYPEIKWVSYSFNTQFTPTGRSFLISNPVCYNGNSNYISYVNDAEIKQLKASNPNFRTQENHFYHTGLRIYDLAMSGVSPIIEKLEKMLKSDQTYEKALGQYNSKQYTEALRTIDMAESIGYSSPRLSELKQKVEEALKNAKNDALKKQLDDLYSGAENKFNNKDLAGAASETDRGLAMLEREKIQDPRFAALKKKIEEEKDKEAKAAEDAKNPSDTAAKTAEQSGSNSSTASESSSENSNSSAEEDPGAAARQAEQERLERQQEYYDRRKAQNEANSAAAAEMSMAALMVHLTIGKAVYAELETLPGNMVSAAGPSIEFHGGYSISSTPVFVNITAEEYDGNTYSYDEYSELRNAFSINLNAGITAWHLKSKHFGLGYHAQITGGHGLVFQNFYLSGVAGIKGYAGSKHLRVYGEYLTGFRDLSYNDWLDAGKIIKGKAKTKFYQLKTGLRISDEIEWNGPTQLHFDFLPVFEVHKNIHLLPYGSNPLGWYWKQGIETAVRIDNRLSFILQCMYEYPVIGTDLFGFKSRPKNPGTFFSLGVIRNLEFYGNHVKKYNLSPSTVKYNAEAKNFVELLCASPKIEFLSSGRKLVNSRTAFHSAGIISVLVNSGMTEHLALSWGGGASYRVMNFTVLEKADLKNGLQNSFSYQSEGITANIPLGIKIHHHFNTGNKFWLLGGIEGRIGLLNSDKARAVDQPESGWGSSDYKVNSGGLYQQYGFGANYTLGRTGFTSGLVYSRAFKTLMPEDISRIQSLEFRFGFIL